MPRDSKNEDGAPEPYRRYRVPDPAVTKPTAENGTVDDIQADGHPADTCGLLLTIGISLFSILFYLAIFGLIAWVIAVMLGLFDGPPSTPYHSSPDQIRSRL